MTAASLEAIYTYGDVYETIDACDQLDVLLGRLKRQHLLDDRECMRSKEKVAEIRSRLENVIATTEPMRGN